MGASFAIATDGVLTLFIAAPPNGSSVWIRVVDEVSGAVLEPAQEAVAVSLRKTLLASLDDLLAVVREFLNPEVSRSGLDRCLPPGPGTSRSRPASPAPCTSM
jgi:hypothetical protein